MRIAADMTDITSDFSKITFVKLSSQNGARGGEYDSVTSSSETISRVDDPRVSGEFGNPSVGHCTSGKFITSKNHSNYLPI